MANINVCYIYVKDKDVVVKNHCKTISIVHKELIESGYIHVASVDPAIYIQSLLKKHNLTDIYEL